MNYNYDRSVMYYDQTRAFAPGVEQRAVAAIAAALSLAVGGRLLEIGVGSGRLALPLAQASDYRYHGQDISAGMMGRLREKPSPKQRIMLTQSDAAALPYQAGSFGAVLAVHVMHLLPDVAAALREVRRVLKAGGRLISVRDNLPVGDDLGAKLEAQMALFLGEEGYAGDSRQQSKGNVTLAALTTAGAREVQSSVAFGWTLTTSPRAAFAMIAGRQTRGLWAVPEDIFQPALLRLGGWLGAEYRGVVDEPIPQERNFEIITALF